MCGIATIAIGRSSRGRIPYPLLRKLAKELLLQIQPRGMDASGIAVVNDAKGKTPSGTCVFKKPLRPSSLVVRPKFEEALSNIGPDTNFILLHSRSTTVGDTQDNYNNHPIVAGPIVGIHNGTLFNHEKLFRKFEKEIKQEGEVDSEIIFRLYGHYLNKGLSPKQAMQQAIRLLEGAFTGAAVDLRHSHRMLMFAFERPLCVLKLAHYDMVIAISDVKYYDRAKRTLNIKAKDSCSWVEERRGRGFLFDLNVPDRLVNSIYEYEIPVDRNLAWLRKNWSHKSWVSSGK